MLPDKAVLEFIEIFEDRFGITLTTDEAKTKAEDFIQLFDLLLVKANKDNSEILDKKI